MYQHVSGRHSYCVSGFCWFSQNDHHYKMASEANTFKKRMERAEAKLVSVLPTDPAAGECAAHHFTHPAAAGAYPICLLNFCWV